jgi:hypothetical protein
MLATRSLAFLLAASVLASCNTYRVAGAMTYGRTHDLSAAEIEAAVAAYRRHRPDQPPPVGQIQVVSSAEIRIYWGDSTCCYTTMVRKHRQWRFDGDQVALTE